MISAWFSLQNLNKLALGDITRQNFPVSCLIFRDFLAWYGLAVGLAVKLEQVGVWRYNKAELPGLLSHFGDYLAWFGGLV